MSEASRRLRALVERAVAGALALGYFALAAVFLPAMWREGKRKIKRVQDPRIAIRPLMAREHITRGIVLIPDVHSYWRRSTRGATATSGCYLFRQRGRGRPAEASPRAAGVHGGRREDRARVGSSAPGPGLRVEMERAWLPLQRPIGLSAGIIHTLECCLIPTSGQRALRVFAVEPGGRLGVPFDMAHAGGTASG
ncbi:MAG: hypothetical protein IPF99_33055 [Deltaproteobacteria bacterium]|nr:hypothetical protein [Deltaproteobacteria bacterium]